MRIIFVDQDRSLLEESTVAFKNQIERGIQQRVAGTDELRQGSAGSADEILFKGNALVACEYGVAQADNAVPVSDDGGDVRDFVSFGLSLPYRASETLERLDKECRNEMRLQASNLGTLHRLLNCLNAGCIHCIMGKGVFFDKSTQRIMVHRMLDNLIESGAYLRLVAIANRLQQQMPKRFVVEGQLPQDIKDLATERLAFFLYFVQ